MNSSEVPMFLSKTVFVVGAGASEEAGLPIGRQLTSQIADLLNIHTDFGQWKSGDGQIYDTIIREVRAHPDKWNGNNLLGSARHISEAMQLATSIDTFLESFAHDPERVLLGKLGIAKGILRAEKASKLAARNSAEPFDMKKMANTWYTSLAQLLFSGISAQNVGVAFENVSFIVFNYDRCIPVFLIRALQCYFHLSDHRAEEIVKDVRILHPYGSLGSNFQGAADRVAFGTEEIDLMSVANQIDTFSETVRDAETLASIRREISDAETIVFLGFGFHEQNIDVLSEPINPPRLSGRQARVLATTCGLSQSDADVVRSQIANMVWGMPPTGYVDASIHMYPGKCAPFFAEYWRSISAPLSPLF